MLSVLIVFFAACFVVELVGGLLAIRRSDSNAFSAELAELLEAASS